MHTFGDSSINTVGGNVGKLLADGRTDAPPDRRTDGRMDGRRTVTHHPLFFFKKKRGDNNIDAIHQTALLSNL